MGALPLLLWEEARRRRALRAPRAGAAPWRPRAYPSTLVADLEACAWR